MAQVIAYTDGGCRGNPGPGGWGCLIIDPISHDALERCGGELMTTNNRMELFAAIMALRSLRVPGTRLTLHSDSQYVIKAASEWIPGWKRLGWRRKDGPLKNVELLQEIDRLAAGFEVTWKWVKGHDGNPGNERVDELTNQAMDAVQSGRDPTYQRRCVWTVG